MKLPPKSSCQRLMVGVSLLFYVLSFGFPVLVFQGKVSVSGPDAFSLSFRMAPIMVVGNLLDRKILETVVYTLMCFANPLLLVTWCFTLFNKVPRLAFISSIVVLISMTVWGSMAPAHPIGGPICQPGGSLSLGYFLWCFSGISALVAVCIQCFYPSTTNLSNSDTP